MVSFSYEQRYENFYSKTIDNLTGAVGKSEEPDIFFVK
jgi:hypothetical protein